MHSDSIRRESGWVFAGDWQQFESPGEKVTQQSLRFRLPEVTGIRRGLTLVV